MPALPSGQHIAVDPAPLTKLLVECNSPFNAHHLMALEQLDDLFRWIDVLNVRPAESLSDARRAHAKEIPGAPPGHLGVPIGVRLADWRQAAIEWSEADRAAMAAFVDERVRPWLVEDLDTVRRCQEALLASPSTPAGMLAAMWKAGCHPLQDEADANRDLPPRDFNARLAALLRSRALLCHGGLRPDVLPQVRDRLEGALAMFESHLGLPALGRDATLAAWIGALHVADPLASMPGKDRAWFTTQVTVECECLWEGAGDALRQLDRAVHDIIELATLGSVDIEG
jgi:hypothetical protein